MRLPYCLSTLRFSLPSQERRKMFFLGGPGTTAWMHAPTALESSMEDYKNTTLCYVVVQQGYVTSWSIYRLLTLKGHDHVDEHVRFSGYLPRIL